MATVAARATGVARVAKSVVAGAVVAGILITGIGAAAGSAAQPSRVSPEVRHAFLLATGIDPQNGAANPQTDVLPALDFSHIGDLSLSDLSRKDEYGAPLPWGSNHWDCQPDPSHPEPVVLIHGFNTSAGVNHVAMSPLLTAAGYCVFAFNWGHVPGVKNFGHTRLQKGAEELDDFVEKVLQSTHASKVSLVGHSAGGVMPRWYINKLSGGKGKKVSRFFALAPATNGTTANGLAEKYPELAQSMIDSSVQKGQEAVIDLVAGSEFLHQVNTPSPVYPGVRYMVLATADDTMVTPVSSQYLPSGPMVTNYLLQEICPLSHATHGLIAEHPVFFQLLENFLASQHHPIVCMDGRRMIAKAHTA